MCSNPIRIKRRPKGILIPVEEYSPKPVYENEKSIYFGGSNAREDAEVSKEELCLLWGCCFLCWDYTGQGSQSSRKILRRTCQYPWPLTPLNLKSIK